jgi:hypothetical protein
LFHFGSSHFGASDWLKPPRFVAKQIGISGALLKPWRACSKPCWRCWPCAAEVR